MALALFVLRFPVYYLMEAFPQSIYVPTCANADTDFEARNISDTEISILPICQRPDIK